MALPVDPGSAELGLGESLLYRTVKHDAQQANAAGEVTLELGVPERGTYWLVDRAAFVVEGESTGAGAVVIELYVGDWTNDLNLEDFEEIPVGTVDRTVRAIGEFSPAIWVPSSTELFVVYSGLVVNTQAKARARVRVMGDRVVPGKV